ncbi:response regulator containing a CheY-like receiver domain and an HTH DNA-binding domain [Mycolicibacterium tokaiense]|uniref:Response regulator containing a CheY-like receiver domain and an HTH DNA-binding domain n=1 Tax=Mycolicibacterium tokaiense TaxID=39695 RepID=A0A378TJZ9_9MYCO|nr:response regulator containing a CheY-like receiver domain and an HTH DNA-binding domain [Mycolicibacterium tokaiense]
MPTDRVRVVVGDDHPLFRDGLVRALSSSDTIEVVAEAPDGVAALTAIRDHRPDVALLDHQMPGLDGAEVAAAVTRDALPTRVLLVSAHDDPAVVYHALQQGAAGFLPKESTRAEIVSAVLDCAKGRDIVAPRLASGLAVEIRRRAEPAGPTLSAREREVLGFIAAGRSIPSIAEELFLARRRSKHTCSGSTTSSASATAPPRWPRRCAAGCWNNPCYAHPTCSPRTRSGWPPCCGCR